MESTSTAINFSEATSDSSSIQRPSEIFERLYPAILGVFITIISGYFCGRNGIITDVETNGLNIFMSRYDRNLLFSNLFFLSLLFLLENTCGAVTETRFLMRCFRFRLALPAMLFRAMATLDFRIVDWRILIALLIGKSVVFFSVLLFSLLLSWKPLQLGRAALFAILATQSNDFALGFPIGLLCFDFALSNQVSQNYYFLSI